jgi:hypothetical protein
MLSRTLPIALDGEILQLSFYMRDKYYMKCTIGEIVEMIHPKIDDYIEDYKLMQTVKHKDFRAYSVIFIGSRRILFGEVRPDGGYKWTKEGFQLAQYGSMSNFYEGSF